MFVPRWLARLTIPVMVGAALTAGTAIASADATDDAYIAKLHNLGFTWPSSSDSDMIAMGHAVCADRMAGKTPDAIAVPAVRAAPTITGIVSFASQRGANISCPSFVVGVQGVVSIWGCGEPKY